VNTKVTEPNFASLLQRFFTERLIQMCIRDRDIGDLARQ